MKKEEFLIYCLLYAFEAAAIKKQNLVQMALKADAVNFVRVYNIIQQQDETIRKSILAHNFECFDKVSIVEEVKNTFLDDVDLSIVESVVNVFAD